MSVFKLNLSPKTVELIGALANRLPELQRRKAEAREQVRLERQCTAATKENQRCKAWAVSGDTKCTAHGGVKTEESFCDCAAYDFPHRRRSGNCRYPNEPLRKHTTASYKRKSAKRQRKLRVKKWLREIGL